MLYYNTNKKRKPSDIRSNNVESTADQSRYVFHTAQCTKHALNYQSQITKASRIRTHSPFHNIGEVRFETSKVYSFNPWTSIFLEKSNVTDVVTKKDVKLLEKIANSSERPVYLIVRHDGYPSEMHNVTTEDGYKIGLLRIPYGKSKKNPKIQRKP
ncbi:unnamed protein product, partial [Allacma fusca]